RTWFAVGCGKSTSRTSTLYGSTMTAWSARMRDNWFLVEITFRHGLSIRGTFRSLTKSFASLSSSRSTLTLALPIGTENRRRLMPAFIAVIFHVLLLLNVPAATAAETPLYADLLLINGKVTTINKSQPQAEAIAVWRDRILAVGSSDTVRPLAGPRTRVIDL